MLELTIDEGPRFNSRGPEIRGCSPAQIVRYMRRWYPDAEFRRLPWGLKFWASASAVAPDLTAREPGLTVVGYIQEDWGDGAPIPSVPDAGQWPADQPTMWSAKPDEWSTPLAEGGA